MTRNAPTTFRDSPPRTRCVSSMLPDSKSFSKPGSHPTTVGLRDTSTFARTPLMVPASCREREEGQWARGRNRLEQTKGWLPQSRTRIRTRTRTRTEVDRCHGSTRHQSSLTAKWSAGLSRGLSSRCTSRGTGRRRVSPLHCFPAFQLAQRIHGPRFQLVGTTSIVPRSRSRAPLGPVRLRV